MNNNNVVDIVDALLIARYYVGLNPSPFNPDTADVNCDSAINNGLREAINKLDGKRQYFPNSIQGGIHGSGPNKYQEPRYYFDNARCFTTELGTTCVPPIESMRKMIPENRL